MMVNSFLGLQTFHAQPFNNDDFRLNAFGTIENGIMKLTLTDYSGRESETWTLHKISEKW